MSAVGEDFWHRCANAECVVVPVMCYSHWVDGELHESAKEGLRFIALRADIYAVGPDYWTMVEDQVSGREYFFDTPEAALQDFINRRA